MKKIIDFLLNNLALIAFIAMLDALGWLFLSDSYRAFLHPRFWSFLILAILILAGFVLAAVLGSRLRLSARARMDTAVKTVILMLPLLVMYTVAGQGLGSQALSKKYTGTEQDMLDMLPGGNENPLEELKRKDGRLSLLDIARNLKQLDGEQVTTEGQVYRDRNIPPNYLLLYRFAMFCCAADAFPVWVLVEKESLDVDIDKWIEVAGRMEVTNINGRDIPVIKAETIEVKALPSPGARYLYF